MMSYLFTHLFRENKLSKIKIRLIKFMRWFKSSLAKPLLKYNRSKNKIKMIMVAVNHVGFQLIRCRKEILLNQKVHRNKNNLKRHYQPLKIMYLNKPTRTMIFRTRNKTKSKMKNQNLYKQVNVRIFLLQYLLLKIKKVSLLFWQKLY